MSSDPVPTEVPPTATPPHPPNHPSITITFPIVVITNPPSSSSDTNSQGPDVQNAIAPEELQNLFARFLRAPFASGQFEPMPAGNPKKHATQSALDTLKSIDVTSLPEGDRRCHICMQDYYVRPVGPRSPYVEDVKDEDDLQNVLSSTREKLTCGKEETVPSPSEEEDREAPLEMPCGHVFGSTCLKAWLYQSPTCPLCRVEVESYTDEPQTPEIPPLDGQIPFLRVDPVEQQPEQQEDMEIDSTTTEPTNPPQAQTPRPQIPRLAFQLIWTTGPPTTPPPQNPTTAPVPPPPTPSTPNISRPASSHTIRHHPYARTVTPSPLSTSSVSDRPDLFCAQRASGLCSHDISDESLLRLECGHAFHEDCLEESMVIDGYPIEQVERRCPRCRRWMSILQ
jgi:hypothetical protein